MRVGVPCPSCPIPSVPTHLSTSPPPQLFHFGIFNIPLCFSFCRSVCGLSFVPIQGFSWVLGLHLPSARKGFGDIFGRETAMRVWPGAKALAAAVKREKARNEL